jgi:hypothetical protein
VAEAAHELVPPSALESRPPPPDDPLDAELLVLDARVLDVLVAEVAVVLVEPPPLVVELHKVHIGPPGTS